MASPLFVIPSYAHQETLDAVLNQLETQECIVIDDGSPIPLSTKKPCIRHEKNRGYGRAQKTGFLHALSGDWDPIVLVHGDNQYEPRSIIPWLSQSNRYPIVLGSRFLNGIPRNMPKWRRWGNALLTTIANQKFSRTHTDLHTGARIFQRDFLKQVPFLSFSDNFVFDQQILIWAMRQRIEIGEFPMPAKYDESVSSIPPLESIRYGLGCLAIMKKATPPNDPIAP